MYQPSEARIIEVHSRLAGYSDFLNLAEASRVAGRSQNLVRACILAGVERGWYATRPSENRRNPRTGEPATEYKALSRIDVRSSPAHAGGSSMGRHARGSARSRP